MGWASGSELADDLWRVTEKLIPKEKRKGLAKQWVKAFQSMDCDTMHETEVGELAGLNEGEDDAS